MFVSVSVKAGLFLFNSHTSLFCFQKILHEFIKTSEKKITSRMKRHNIPYLKRHIL